MNIKTNAREKFGAGISHRACQVTVWLIMVFGLSLFNPQAVLAQSFQIIHYFSGAEGANPAAGVTVGGDGVLYGTTVYGVKSYGAVYELKQSNSTWSFLPLYLFNGGADGANPESNPVIASDNALYGTTSVGGASGMGVVYRLTPSPSICRTAFCYLNESVVYAFSGPDGSQPGVGSVVFDQAGNIYGTTTFGGDYGQGAVYKLTKSGDTWSESQRYSFSGIPNDGANPTGGLVFDSKGNFYGTTELGGSNPNCYYLCGTAYEITPSGQTWTEQIIHNFGDGPGGYWPFATLIIDPQGNLYGSDGCTQGQCPAAIFQLSPSQNSWTFNSLSGACPNNISPMAMDAVGDLYGACASPSFVFKLSYSNHQWQLQHLHDFLPAEGAYPVGSVALDSNGNLFGTAEYGGNSGLGCDPTGCGTVWEIAGAAAPARQGGGTSR